MRLRPRCRHRRHDRSLVQAIRGPVSLYALEGLPGVAGLERLGVAHVSVGSGPYQACLALLEEIAQSLFRDGSFAPMLKRQLTYAEVQKLVGGQTA